MVWIKAAGIGSRVEIEVVVTAVTVTRHRVRLSTRAMRAAFATAASCHQLCPPQSAMTVSRIKAEHRPSVGRSVDYSYSTKIERRLAVGCVATRLTVVATQLSVELSVGYLSSYLSITKIVAVRCQLRVIQLARLNGTPVRRD